MSLRPDHVSVSRQHPAEGTSTSEGPGPFLMIVRTGAPTGCAPFIFWSLIQRAATPFGACLDTQRILLFLFFAGGALRGDVKSAPPMRPRSPSTYGMRGRGPLNPARIHTGSTS